MLRDVIITIMAILFMGLIMGKALISALANLIAWIMNRLAEVGYFNVTPKFDYMDFYEAHAGDLDIEH